jgi:hypothetical protein
LSIPKIIRSRRDKAAADKAAAGGNNWHDKMDLARARRKSDGQTGTICTRDGSKDMARAPQGYGLMTCQFAVSQAFSSRCVSGKCCGEQQDLWEEACTHLKT